MLEHILVIEDDEFMRESLEIELRSAGYRVSVAADGYRALALAKDQHFDLVVSDVRMPGLSGLDTLSALREVQPAARNIVITGYADADAPVAAVKLGVDDYLLKPFTSQELLASVRQALEKELEERRKQRASLRLRELMLQLATETPQPETQAISARVRRLARAVGLGESRSLALQLAVWLRPHRSFLDTVEELKPLGQLLEQAEESFDGRGPLGLRGDAIPVDARILRAAWDPDPTAGGCDPALLPILARTDDEESFPPLPQFPVKAVHSLLTIARSALNSGRHELAGSAFNEALQLLESDPDPEVEASIWLQKGRLYCQLGIREAAVAAAARATRLAEPAGLERLWAEAVLLRAELGQATLAELVRARQVLGWFEATASMLEADMWLSGLGHGEALDRLLVGLAQEEELWQRCAPTLARVLGEVLHHPGLQRAIEAAGDRALPLLREWLQPQAPVGLRLRALDFLALLDTRGAQALLAQTTLEPGSALAQKSALLLQSRPTVQTQVQVLLFGRLRILVGGQPLGDDGLGTRKTRGLFAYLATRRGQAVPEDVLIDQFWQGEESKARHSLHNAVSQIRKALKNWLGETTPLLVKERDTYSLAAHPSLWIDAEEFRQHRARAEQLKSQARPAEAMAELKGAERLFRGEFLEGDYTDWTEGPRRQFQAELMATLTTLAQFYFEQGRHEASLEYWKRLLERDNCNEDAYLGAMLCQMALERQGEAVRLYHQCVKTLRQELNLGPPPRVVETYLRLVDSSRDALI